MTRLDCQTMRIAVFQVTSSYAIGGCETYTWNLCHYLQGRGYASDLIAGLTDQPRQRYPEVKLLMAPFVPRERVLDLGSRFRKLVERITFAWHARDIVCGGRYDILNIHKPYDIPAALWFRRQTGCRIVWRCHGTDFYAGLRHLIGRIDSIYCVSNFARDTLVARYPVRASVIHTGVDTRFFDPAHETVRASDTPRIVYFGRLEGWKGVRYLVDALGLLRDAAWTARIIGEGPEHENLTRQIAMLDLSDRIRIEGALYGRERIRQLLADADIAVFPAVGVETFSNAVLEAMSMETAVVATRVGGFPEAISDGSTGMLVEARRADALAEAIRHLLVDPKLRRTLSKAARRTVVERFDADQSFQRVELLFERLSQRS